MVDQHDRLRTRQGEELRRHAGQLGLGALLHGLDPAGDAVTRVARKFPDQVPPVLVVHAVERMRQAGQIGLPKDGFVLTAEHPLVDEDVIAIGAVVKTVAEALESVDMAAGQQLAAILQRMR